MYDFVVDLIGELPTEFTFIYSILTLVMAMLLLVSYYHSLISFIGI